MRYKRLEIWTVSCVINGDEDDLTGVSPNGVWLLLFCCCCLAFSLKTMPREAGLRTPMTFSGGVAALYFVVAVVVMCSLVELSRYYGTIWTLPWPFIRTDLGSF